MDPLLSAICSLRPIMAQDVSAQLLRGQMPESCVNDSSTAHLGHHSEQGAMTLHWVPSESGRLCRSWPWWTRRSWQARRGTP